MESRKSGSCLFDEFSHLMTRQPLASIAPEVGFTDQSRLTGVFRRETGLTPDGSAPLWPESEEF
jgi:AraC-like DNA-binding protein